MVRKAMQTIPQTYKQAGFQMKLEKREGNVALYASAGGDYFEVHRVRVSKAREIMGKPYPEREILAGNEDFGAYGWACVDRPRAETRFANALGLNEASS